MNETNPWVWVALVVFLVAMAGFVVWGLASTAFA